ncbi:MAG: GTP-binding protein [bacterium P3]|nr:MAG: GTP-binding protein [bacterium P3]KWW40964.1 MAG: GTP-binding protein [bacterium F083]
MTIRSATFIISNSDYRKCPDDGKPEYAFIGRSNVGKSSLINMLTGVKGLAKTSGRPGKTQLINHFLINGSWYLVDLPGYGFAQISKQSRQRWQQMTERYLLHRETLTNVYVLVDSRIEPRPIDLEFINFLGHNGVPMSVVFTKTDGEKQREVMRHVNQFKAAMSEDWESLPDMIMTSAATGFGRDALLAHIDSINNSLSPTLS